MAAHPSRPAATAPPTAPFSPRFRPLPFLGCHLAAALLLLSWLWAPTRQLRDLFDDRIFTLLNHSLRAGGLWAESWALASLRPIDLVTALVMLLVLRRDLAVDRATARRALFGFAAMLGLLLAIRVTFSAVAAAAGWTRPARRSSSTARYACPSCSRTGRSRIHRRRVFPAITRRSRCCGRCSCRCSRAGPGSRWCGC